MHVVPIQFSGASIMLMSYIAANILRHTALRTSVSSMKDSGPARFLTRGMEGSYRKQHHRRSANAAGPPDQSAVLGAKMPKGQTAPGLVKPK